MGFSKANQERDPFEFLEIDASYYPTHLELLSSFSLRRGKELHTTLGGGEGRREGDQKSLPALHTERTQRQSG